MMRIGRASYGPRYVFGLKGKRVGAGAALAALAAASFLVIAASEIAKEQANAPALEAAARDNAIRSAAARPSDDATASPARADNLNDRQRRLLMLLLMNSAGPMRPYGNLGR
jgi:hypothetical protein